MKLLEKPCNNYLHEQFDRLICDGITWRVFLFTFAAGMVVHFLIITNLTFNHDTLVLPYTNFDWLLAQGKWFVTPLNEYKGPIVLSYLGGVVGIAASAAISTVICAIFSIQSKHIAYLVGVAVVTFPSVATTLMYQACDYFMLAALMSVLAAYFLSRRDWLSALVGIGLLTLSLGAYQGYIGFTAAILVILCIIDLLHEEKKWKEVLLTGVLYIAELIASIGVYYIVLQRRLHQTGVSLSSYKGIDNMAGILEPKRLWSAVVGAMKNVAGFFLHDNLGMPSTTMICIYTCLLVVILAVSGYIACKRKLLNDVPRCVLLSLLLLVCLPLASNLIGVLSSNQSYYYITIYPFVMIPITLLILVQDCVAKSDTRTVTGVFKILSTVLLALCVCSWGIRTNQGYQKLLLENYNIKTKSTVLVAQIQGVDGYSVDASVVFVGNTPYTFLSSQGVGTAFDAINTAAMGLGSAAGEIYSSGVLQYYLENYIAPNMKFLGEESLTSEAKEQVKQMPVYPNSGAIRSLDGYIVVKLGELSE